MSNLAPSTQLSSEISANASEGSLHANFAEQGISVGRYSHFEKLDPKTLVRYGPSSRVYGELVLRGGLAHGEDIREELHQKNLTYEARYSPRISKDELEGRLNAVADYAGEILRQFKEFESVFFYGSALRGVPDNNDYDIMALSKPGFRNRVAQLPEWLREGVEIVGFPLWLFVNLCAGDPTTRNEAKLEKSCLPRLLLEKPIAIDVKSEFYKETRSSNCIEMIWAFPPGASFLLSAGPLVGFFRGTSPGSLATIFSPGTSNFDAGDLTKRTCLSGEGIPIRI